MIIIASFLLLLCSCVGIALRYAPFAPIISPHQKRDLRICYTIAIMLKLVSLVILMAAGGVEGAFLYLRYGLLFHAAILTLVNIFLIPGHLREHLFVFGVVMTFKYLLMAIPNYLITLYPDGTPTAYLFLILVTYTATLLISYFPLRRLLKKPSPPSSICRKAVIGTPSGSFPSPFSVFASSRWAASITPAASCSF